MPARATLHGTITATGGENATQRGFDWGYTSGSYPYSWTESGSFGTGSFNHIIDGLNLNVTVYFRAKAVNSAGWGYGTEKSFLTPVSVTFKLHLPLSTLLLRPRFWALSKRYGEVQVLRRAYIPFKIPREAQPVVE